MSVKLSQFINVCEEIADCLADIHKEKNDKVSNVSHLGT